MAAARAVLTLALTGALAGALAGACARPAALARVPTCERCHGVHLARLGACVDCHRGNPRAGRAGIAHAGLLRGEAAAWRLPGSRALAEGARLRDALGCRRCHVTGGRGNAWAISLDRVVGQREQDALRQSILHPARFMPDFSLSASQADELIARLLHDAGPGGGEARYLVRFRARGAWQPDAFTTYCGDCHRALTALGPLGTGSSGPNLTGLLGEFYPAPDGGRWDAPRLERWVRNPRQEKPAAIMPPVRIGEPDLRRVVEILAAPTPR